MSTQLRLPPNEVLREALRDGTVQHPDGHNLDLVANISPANSAALYETVRHLQPALVVEIGMAYGVSTLSILTALRDNGDGRLISIDPYIGWPTGRLIALHQVDRAGLSHLHEHRHLPSYMALPSLIEESASPDLVYIDGNHNFEYAFTDFFFADKLLSIGGVVGFNDSGWKTVFRVIRFLRRYRKYEEMDVNLPRTYRARNVFFSLIKRLEGRSTNDRYFRKLDDSEPAQGFYRRF